MSLSKKMLACLTALLMMILSSAVALAAESGVDWERGVIRATGIGAGKSTTKNKGLKRAQARRRAAMMDAQRGLAEAAKGVRVTSNSKMIDLELADDRVATQVDTIIKNMTEVDGRYIEADELYEIVLEMPLFGSTDALSTAAFIPFKDEPKVSFPQPVNTNQPTVANKNYTGLIIDCSGTGKKINHVMSPVIKNGNGQEIYGHKNLDYDKIIVQGMASYANSTNDQISQSRAGSNPLIVKAVRLDDLNANPVVSVEDADKILATNQHDRLFSEVLARGLLFLCLS